MIIKINDTTKILKKYKYIGSGKTAKCFLSPDNQVLKLYKNNYYTYSLFKCYDIIEHIKKLSELNNDTFICPKYILINNNKLIGYTYEYINGKSLYKCNIDLETIINNYSLIEQNTKKISKKYFLLRDLHPKNIIFNDKFSIIDLDHGIFLNDTYDKIFNENMQQINNVLVHYLFGLYEYYDINFINSTYNKLYKDAIINDYSKIIELFEQLLENDYIKRNDVKRKKHTLITANINDYKYSKLLK